MLRELACVTDREARVEAQSQVVAGSLGALRASMQLETLYRCIYICTTS